MIINDGKIAQFGKPEEIIGKPENGFVKKFILNQLEIKKNNIYALFSGQLENRHRCAEEVGTMRKNREIKLIFAIVAVFFAGIPCGSHDQRAGKVFYGDGTAVSLATMWKCSPEEDS